MLKRQLLKQPKNQINSILFYQKKTNNQTHFSTTKTTQPLSGNSGRLFSVIIYKFQLYFCKQQLYSFQIMKPNNNNHQKLLLNTPNIFPNMRPRGYSFNTPMLSPLRMIQSPFINLGQGSIFDNQLNMAGQFRLQEGVVQQNVQPVQQSSDQSVSEMQFPKFPMDAKVTKDNMIDFLVDAININQEKIMKVKESFDQLVSPFVSQVFTYIYKRFKKVKKTKEEMIKYTMRKSFKFITDQMKKEDPSLIPLLATDGLEGMSIYFTKHCQDSEIFIPFKKNSLEKTMNTSFLKKVFSVYRFYKDYKKFLKTFQNQFLKDNKKKVATMSQAVKQCINTKNFKSLQNFKRLPWTKDILVKLKQFAVQLLNYSIFTKEGVPRPVMKENRQQIRQNHHKYSRVDFQSDNEKPAPKRSMDSLHFQQTYRDLINNDFIDDKQEEEVNQQFNQKKMKKKIIIILTPSIHPINSPKIPDLGLSLQ